MTIQIATVRDAQSAEYLKTIALREKSQPKALALWTEALELAPGNATLLGHKAHALLDDGRDREVVALLSAALPEHARNVHLANMLGVALYRCGHANEGTRLFRLCLDIDHEYPTAQESLARARRSKRRHPAPASVRAAIGAAVARAAERPAPRLSVCMIAKDESEFVAGAIESVRGVAYEVIVVDTGSSDDTVAICERAGARIGHLPWAGDFATARNHSIDMALGDWILILDADERLAPGSRSMLRAIMEEEGDPHRIVCPKVENYTRDGRRLSDGFSGRVFRNVPTMRYSGRIHEEVGVGLPDCYADYRLDVVLEHFGSDPEVIREKAKDERNVALLEARLAEKPDDLLTWFYLGSQHWIGRRFEPARHSFERVVELFERNPSRYGMAIRHVPVPYSYVGLVRGLVLAGDSDQALAVADRGLARWPDIPDLWFHAAFAWLAKGDNIKARPFLERARDVEPRGYNVIGMQDESIKRWRAAKALGDLDFEAEDEPAAYACYRAIFERIPVGDEERVQVAARLVELASNVGDLEALPNWLETYMKLRPDQTDVALQVAWYMLNTAGHQSAYDLLANLYRGVEPLRTQIAIPLAVGQIAEDAGEDAEALNWYQRVIAIGHEDPQFWAGVAKLLLRLGEPRGAADALQLAQRYMTAARAG